MDYIIADGNKTSFRQRTLPLAANGQETVPGLCNFIELLSCTADNVQISFNDGATYSDFFKGIRFHANPGEVFRDIRLLDTSGSTNTLVVGYGQGDIQDARLVVTSSVNLPVSIAAQTLSPLVVSGSVTPVVPLLGSTGITVAATAAGDTSADLISAAANTAGVTVSNLSVWLDQIPASYAYVKVGTRFLMGVKEGGFWTLPYPVRIESGVALVLNYLGRVDVKGAY